LPADQAHEIKNDMPAAARIFLISLFSKGGGGAVLDDTVIPIHNRNGNNQ
jgi:hypothetical protein